MSLACYVLRRPSESALYLACKIPSPRVATSLGAAGHQAAAIEAAGRLSSASAPASAKRLASAVCCDLRTFIDNYSVRDSVRARTTASDMCRDLQFFIVEMEGREMHRSLRAVAEKYLEGIAAHLDPQVRLLRGIDSALLQFCAF